MKKPPSMATRFQSSIAKTEAVGGTSEVKIMFTDASGFSFQAVAGDPKPKVNGAGDSLAHEFATGVNKYTFLAAGVQMAFSDGSSCNLNFGKAIADLQTGRHDGGPAGRGWVDRSETTSDKRLKDEILKV